MHTNEKRILFTLLSFILTFATGPLWADDAVHLRVNQIGYHTKGTKTVIAFSNKSIEGKFSIVEVTSGEAAFSGAIAKSDALGWGTFAHHFRIDFTKLTKPGRYRVRIDSSGELSRPFSIGDDVYVDHVESLLRFMRQQRCGYNPVLDIVCHKRDGRTAFGLRPAGTFIDASGGWHDAGDQLKYLLTGSNATARMLLAYQLEPTKFDDRTDRLGHPLPNGIPDVLDEARWGLDWIFKSQPKGVVPPSR